MLQPVRQRQTLAQPIKPPLTQKDLVDFYYQLHKEISHLRPVRFVFFPQDPNNPFSLPESVGRILYQEGLVDISGNPIYQHRLKINDSVYKHRLEAKLFLALADHTAHLNYFKNFSAVNIPPPRVDLKTKWETAVHLVCEELAREASIHFCLEFLGSFVYGHQPPFFSNQKFQGANKASQKIINQLVKNKTNFFQDFIGYFITPLSGIPMDVKKNVIRQSLEVLTQKIPWINPIPQAFFVTLDPQKISNLIIHYLY